MKQVTNIKQTAKDLKEAILNKDKDLSLSLFQLGLQEAEEEFVFQLRKLGVMRCSTYDFQFQILSFLVNKTGGMNISQVNQNYFKSLKSIYSISRDVQALFKVLMKEIDSLEMKSYLVAIDSLFWSLHTPQEYTMNSRTSREDLASAFSFYVYCSHIKAAAGNSKLNEVNEKRLNEKYYLSKLKDFSKIIFFKECEIFIDCFGYIATTEGEKVILRAPHETFEMSLRIGYLRHSTQDLSISLESLSELREATLSMHEFSKAYYKEFKESTFKIIEKPLKRIVMQLPNIKPLKDILGSKSIFLEEEIIVKQIRKNFLINFEQLDKVTVYKNLSLFDIIKIQRLFAFIFCLFSEYIESNNLFKSKLFWRSVLPVFRADELKGFLGNFFEAKKAEEIFDLLSWKLESKKIFDLQTYPFINVEKWTILPLGILTNSNLCRNLLQAIGFRFDSESSEDPIVLAMEKCLEPNSSITKTNVNYSFNGVKGEIDVLAVIDDCIFIFECKNSLHPCNPFELRTTYDYIQKAANQLNRFCDLWKQESFRQYLATKIKAGNPLPSQLCMCIVTGNRMFSGLREQGHSVRPIHELCNIIRTGEISLDLYDFSDQRLARESVSIKLWKKDRFSAEDLLNYIQEDSLHKCYFNSMEKFEYSIRLNKNLLVQETYLLNLDSFFQPLVNNFKAISQSDLHHENSTPH